MKSAIKVLAFLVTATLAVSAQAQLLVCSIQAYDGHFLTAVGGGGRTTDVLHTNAVSASAWERFTLIELRDNSPSMKYAIRTVSGNYLTAVGGGGRKTDAIHSDAVNIGAWEKFRLVPMGNQIYGIQTVNGNYLTAQDSGGRVSDVIHTDAVQLKNWEKFKVLCRR